ncbi:MAG: hypothetical protein Q9204_002675 [Flavoplaca sp. TL-2023a]
MVGCKIGLRLVGDDPISRLLALLVGETYGKNVPPGAASRGRSGREDGWLDYGAPDVSPMDSGRDGLTPDTFDDDKLHADLDRGSISPLRLDERAPDVILQRDECLSCTIRKAVAITGQYPGNDYWLCSTRNGQDSNTLLICHILSPMANPEQI